MKYKALLAISCFQFLFTVVLHAQDNMAWSGNIIPVGYKELGAVRGTAGIIDDSYYVIENDYGPRFDMNNNILTYVAIISIKDGSLIKRIALNDLLASTKKEVNKILFCDVIVWKDQLIGFYTHKNPSGTEFMAKAIILNKKGDLVSEDLEIGKFRHEKISSGGRNTLSVVKDFHIRFSPDSSRMIALSIAEKNSNIHFKVYKPGLQLDRDIFATIPIERKSAELVQFQMDNKGIIYVLTKSEKSKADKKGSGDDFIYQIHSINTAENDKVTSTSFELSEKLVKSVDLGLMASEQPVCAGFYSDLSRKKVKDYIHGAFTVKFNTPNLRPSITTKPIPDSVIKASTEHHTKKGLSELLAFHRFEPRDGGGAFAFGQSNKITTTVRGSSGATNTYAEGTWWHFVYAIDESGKILWESMLERLSSNKELATRYDRVEYVVDGAKTHGMIAWRKPNAIHHFVSSSTGTIKNTNVRLSDEQMNYPIVEGTLRRLPSGEFIAIGFGDNGKQAWIRLIKFTL